MGCDCLPDDYDCGQLAFVFIFYLSFSYTRGEYWLSVYVFVVFSVCSSISPMWETYVLARQACVSHGHSDMVRTMSSCC